MVAQLPDRRQLGSNPSICLVVRYKLFHLCEWSEYGYKTNLEIGLSGNMFRWPLSREM